MSTRNLELDADEMRASVRALQQVLSGPGGFDSLSSDQYAALEALSSTLGKVAGPTEPPAELKHAVRAFDVDGDEWYWSVKREGWVMVSTNSEAKTWDELTAAHSPVSLSVDGKRPV